MEHYNKLRLRYEQLDKEIELPVRTEELLIDALNTVLSLEKRVHDAEKIICSYIDIEQNLTSRVRELEKVCSALETIRNYLRESKEQK